MLKFCCAGVEYVSVLLIFRGALRGTSAKVVCPPLTRGRPEPRQHLGIGGHAYAEFFPPLRFNRLIRSPDFDGEFYKTTPLFIAFQRLPPPWASVLLLSILSTSP